MGAGAILLAGTAPALAAAQQFRLDGCEDEDDGVVVFGTSHGVINRTETPSGNTTYVTQMKYDLTFTFEDGTTYTAVGSSHYHELVRKGEIHQFHLRHREVFNASDGTTCTADFFYQFANGEIRFDKTELSGDCP